MELAHKILADYFARSGYLEELIEPSEIIHDRCYTAICKIRQILDNEVLDDPECFQKIEEIVAALEEMGLDAGIRHDY